MTITMFLMLLSAFSALSGVTTEGIKKLITDKQNFSYNIIALIVSLIIGGIGCTIYYQLSSIPFTLNNIIYIILMGLASGLCSMVGYDKLKQTITQLNVDNITNKAVVEVKEN